MSAGPEQRNSRRSNRSPKPYDPAKVRLAKMSWMLPIIGIGFSLTTIGAAERLGMIRGAVFLSGIVIGLGLAVVALALSRRYDGLMSHAIVGLTLNLFLIVLTVVMFFALAKLEEATRDHGKVRPGSPRCNWQAT